MAVPLELLLRERPLLGALAMFGAGLATSLTPCVYPMIPIVAGVMSGQGREVRSRSRVVGYAMTYAGGVALVYASLGLLAGLTGSLFGAVSSNRWSYFIVGNVLLLAGLAMLDVVRLAVPAPVLAWVGRFGADSYPGVFAMGATSGLVAAPCGAPAFGVALTFVAASGSGVLGFVYLFVFSLGMTALLLGVGLVSGFAAVLPLSLIHI